MIIHVAHFKACKSVMKCVLDLLLNEMILFFRSFVRLIWLTVWNFHFKTLTSNRTQCVLRCIINKLEKQCRSRFKLFSLTIFAVIIVFIFSFISSQWNVDNNHDAFQVRRPIRLCYLPFIFPLQVPVYTKASEILLRSWPAMRKFTKMREREKEKTHSTIQNCDTSFFSLLLF